jgi:2-enoate reductase
VKEGRLEDIRPCIGDHEGCLDRIIAGKYISCAVNPATGKEKEFNLRASEERKSVLVVGGGPAGMEVARVARIRGHRVTLWERGNALGGNLIPASVPYFKKDYRTLIDYLSNQIKKLGVTIELEKEATVENVLEMGSDVLFIATGGMPIIPQINGIESSNVITAIDALLGRKEIGHSVVVVGGGLVGCETGVYLAQNGRNVSILEILDQPARHISAANRMHLLKLLEEANVRIHTEVMVSEMMHDNLIIRNKQNRSTKLNADTVVIAVGLKPNDFLAKALKEKRGDVYLIGDCVRPRKAMDAIWEGFRIARLI